MINYPLLPKAAIQSQLDRFQPNPINPAVNGRQFISRHMKAYRSDPCASTSETFSPAVIHQLAVFKDELPSSEEKRRKYIELELSLCARLVALNDEEVRDRLMALQCLILSVPDAFATKADIFCRMLRRDRGDTPAQTEILSKEIVRLCLKQKDKLVISLALINESALYQMKSFGLDDYFWKALSLVHGACHLVLGELKKISLSSDARVLLKTVLSEALRSRLRLLSVHAGASDSPFARSTYELFHSIVAELDDPYIKLQFLGGKSCFYSLLSKPQMELESLESMNNWWKNHSSLHSLSPYANFFVMRANIESLQRQGNLEQAAYQVIPFIRLWEKYPNSYQLDVFRRWKNTWLRKYAADNIELSSPISRRQVYTTPIRPLLYSNLGYKFLRL